jgi:3-hydroxybutyrate dehydrogenase
VSPIENFPVKKWNQMIGIMLTSPYILIQRFLPGMRESGNKNVHSKINKVHMARFLNNIH